MARYPAWAVGTGASAVTLTALCLRNRFLWWYPMPEQGDFAANSILVDRAARFRLLTGHYSRLGFHHPGPAYLYVQAAGEVLWYRTLHLVPTPFNGQLVMLFVLNAVWIGLVVGLVHASMRSVPLSGLALGVMLVFLSRHTALASAWMPHLYLATFLAFAVAAVSLATGRLAALPAVILAGGFLVHGHVSFVEFVGAGTVAAGIAWLGFHRSGRIGSHGAGRRRPEGAGTGRALAAHRGALVASALLAALLLLPMVLNIVLHYPGDWGRYWRYVRVQHPRANPVGVALRYEMRLWAARGRSGLLLAGAGAAGLVAAWLEPDRERRRFLLTSVAAVAVVSALFLVYAIRGIDQIQDTYMGIFYQSMPLLLLMTSALAVGGLALRRWRAAGPVIGALAVGLAGAGVLGPQMAAVYRGDLQVGADAAAIASSPARHGRAVGLVFPHDLWPETVGLALAGERSGVVVCVPDAGWEVIFTPRHICPPGGTVWTVHIDPPGTPVPAGATAVRAGPEAVVWGES